MFFLGIRDLNGMKREGEDMNVYFVRLCPGKLKIMKRKRINKTIFTKGWVNEYLHCFISTPIMSFWIKNE